MARAVCPECSVLHEITPTGTRIAEGWTAMYWRVVLHAARKDGPHRGTICLGSGMLV